MLDFDFDIERTLSRISLLNMGLQDVVTFLASCLMVVGGVVPYIPQYLDISRTKNADGFSLFVCLTLLVANTLRILFWFGHPFELPLLIQSLVMNIAMFAMVHICVRVRRKLDSLGRQRTLIDLNLEDFWQWSDFSSYIQFMSLFTIAASLITVTMISFPVYIETLGLLAVLTEAMLGAPQFYRNYQKKSTAGMSVKMVLMWSCGDIFKTTYFVLRQAPIQFWLCGTLQVMLDFAILLQVFYYGGAQIRRRPSTAHFTGVVAS
jgi:uncharacterized protein with PQ loop repeat